MQAIDMDLESQMIFHTSPYGIHCVYHSDIITSAMASQITNVSIVCPTVCSQKTSKLRIIGLCEGNPPVTGEITSQMASDAENVPIWWHHYHDSTGSQKIILGLGSCPLFKEIWFEQLLWCCEWLMHITATSVLCLSRTDILLSIMHGIL